MNGYDVIDESDTVVVSDKGQSYRVYLPNHESDYIQNKVFTTRQPYELVMLQDMAARLGQDDLVIDVGANIGNHSLYLAAICGCRVEAFEANSKLAAALEQSVALNALQDRLKVHHFALGEGQAKAKFGVLNPANLGAQSLEIGDGEIAVMALDEMGMQAHIRAIKIDVEGMELSVLRGAARLIARDRPLLYVECAEDAAFEDILLFLEGYEYSHVDTFNATPTHLFLPPNLRATKGQDTHEPNSEFLSLLRQNANPAEIRTRLIGLNAHNRSLTRQLAEARASLREGENRIVSSDASVGESREAFEKVRQEGAALKDELDAVRLKYRVVSQQVTQARQESAAAQERLTALESSLQLKSETIDRLGAEKSALEAELAALQSELAIRDKGLEAARAELEMRRALIEQQSSEHHRVIGRQNDAIARAETTRVALTATLEEANWKLDRAQRRLAEMTEQLLAVQGRVTVVQGDRDRLVKKIEDLRAELRGKFAGQARDRGPEGLAPSAVASWIEALPIEQDLVAERWFNLAKRLLPAHAEKVQGLLETILQLKSGAGARRKAARLLGMMRLETGDAAGGLTLLDPLVPGINLSSREERLLRLARSGLTGEELRRAAARIVRSPLRVATIMDEFTYTGFAPECDLQQLSLSAWREELEGFRPEMVLIESAWRGLNDEWGAKVGQFSSEVKGILDWCSANQVPTAFWNKEDPVHYATFLNLAHRFDAVFTTDIDCVARYKAALRHDKVFLLPFACQPELHNPVETAPRKQAFCFAGAYYVRYPDRTRDLDDFLAHLTEHLPFEIFDRNHGKTHPDYMFPESYHKYIVGTLPASEIDRAYKGYDFGINLNSVTNSQSMFARRVFELLASNTRIVSNFAPGLKRFFGDLVIATNSGAEALRRIRTQEEIGVVDRLRLAGLRKVMQEHCYSHRLMRIAGKLGVEVKDSTALPSVTVLAKAKDRAEAERLLSQFESQTYRHARFVLIVSDEVVHQEMELPDRAIGLTSSDVGSKMLARFVEPGSWVTGFSSADHYGQNYLADLVLASRYSAAPVIGKACYYRLIGSSVSQVSGPTYSAVEKIALRRAIVRAELCPDVPVNDWLDSIETAMISQPGVLSLDPYNYCEGAGLRPDLVTGLVDDLIGVNLGLPGPDIEAFADRIPAAPREDLRGAQMFSGAELSATMTIPANQPISGAISVDGGWTIDSGLGNESHVYLYETKERLISALSPKQGGIKVHAHVTTGLNLILVAVWLDEKKAKIEPQFIAPNTNVILTPPKGAVYVRFGVRPRGPGRCTLKGLQLGHHFPPPRPVIGKSRVLLLTNHYPSYQDLYRNGFVHSRVTAYRDLGGITPDIYRLRPNQDLAFHEFQGIECMTGSAEQLDHLLSSGRYDHVLVHFLDPAMWAVQSRHIDRLRVTVWVHGAEVQPWWRRAFNYTSDAERAKAVEASDKRLAFWRGLFDPLPANLHLVFVSRYFAEEVFEDLEVTCPPDHFSVIHNPIDDTLFAYRKKPVKQRGKILSIRPFASRVYANDQTVQAILALQRRDFFNQLEFRIIGDGPLFDEVTAPLVGLPNVTLEKRFLQHPEIAALHRDYGVFLSPSRMDTQGVSRDEAMSSGLVPVTNRVAAIPEFVDQTCGYLAEPEDAEGLARAIAELWKHPEVFSAKSRAAAERVRAKRAKANTIYQELSLMERLSL